MIPNSLLHVAQGEYKIARGDDTVIAAILGSCVAACLWDPENKVGGMNHILLPATTTGGVGASCIAVNAMELLVNGLLREGAIKGQIQAKLFGGASLIASSSEIGQRNAQMASQFLSDEGIVCHASSLGGGRGRKIQFWPASGRVRQQFLPDSTVVEEAPPPPPTPKTSFELF